MRRDYFTLELRDIEDAGDQPTVRIAFEGPSDAFDVRLTPETDLDVAFRFQTAVDDDDATGVLALTDRITGDFVLEVNAKADVVLDLIDAAQAFGQSANDADGGYNVIIEGPEEQVLDTEKRTLLVYDSDGSLLRKHSLIPSGVEL